MRRYWLRPIKCSSKTITGSALSFLIASCVFAAPTIVSVKPDGTLTWTNTTTSGVVTIQASQNPVGAWTAVGYAPATTNLTTVVVPVHPALSCFYRLILSADVADPSLVLHLAFNNDFASSGTILDTSGYGNHALRYSLTNWPSPISGPDRSMAGDFHRIGSFEGGGDYAGIPWTTNAPFYGLTNGTLLAWGYYSSNSYPVSTIIDGSSYYTYPGSWFLGRDYSYNTRFDVYFPNGGFVHAAVYPDDSPNLDSGGWHYYGVTWDGTKFLGYFDGVIVSVYPQAGLPALVLGGHPWAQWIGIGCQVHDGTPQIDGDGYPGGGWFDGGIDDIRIYNRALNSSEILSLYDAAKN